MICFFMTETTELLVMVVAVTFRHSCSLVITWRRVVLHFIDPKQLLQISCFLWCYLSKWFPTILQDQALVRPYFQKTYPESKYATLQEVLNFFLCMIKESCSCDKLTVPFYLTDSAVRRNKILVILKFHIHWNQIPWIFWEKHSKLRSGGGRKESVWASTSHK